MNYRVKIITILITMLLVIAVIVLFIVLPTIREIKRIQQEIHTERVDLERKYARGQLLRETLENFERIKPNKKKLDSIFILEGQELAFITTLEHIAAKNNVSQKISLQAIGSEFAGAEALPLTLSAQGSFQNVLQYLIDVERLNYYFNVNSLTMTGADGSGRTPNFVSIVVDGTVFSRLPDEGEGTEQVAAPIQNSIESESALPAAAENPPLQ